MNCPNCGAENEAEARFCAECGTPLDAQPEVESTPPEAAGEDQTILSSGPLVAEDAKTVSVTQDDVAVAGAEPEVEVESPSSPEESSPPAEALPKGGSASSGPGWASQRNLIIIAVVVLVLLCCCCLTLGLLGTAFSDVFEDIMYEFGMRSTPLLFV
jgi:hypothetical protein